VFVNVLARPTQTGSGTQTLLTPGVLNFATAPAGTQWGSAYLWGTGSAPAHTVLTAVLNTRDPPAGTSGQPGPAYCGDGKKQFTNCFCIGGGEGCTKQMTSWCTNKEGNVSATPFVSGTPSGVITFNPPVDWGYPDGEVRKSLGGKTLTVNWGDNSTLTVASGTTATHVYTTAGPYLVTGRIQRNLEMERSQQLRLGNLQVYGYTTEDYRCRARIRNQV
jgi:hypothetical protein